MLEVPALLWQLPGLCGGSTSSSIGTDDLLEFLFACDRGNPRFADRYASAVAPNASAVTRGGDADGHHLVPLSMCGEMAGSPFEAMVLIARGSRTLSLTGTAIGPVKAMIGSLDAAAVAEYVCEIGTRPDHSLRPKLEAYALDHAITL